MISKNNGCESEKCYSDLTKLLYNIRRSLNEVSLVMANFDRLLIHYQEVSDNFCMSLSVT